MQLSHFKKYVSTRKSRMGSACFYSRLKSVFTVLCAGYLSLMLAGCQDASKPAAAPVSWHSLDLTGGLPTNSLISWSLPSTRPNQVRTGLSDFKGKALLVFFGYTQCPDVCPTTLSMLANARKQLGSDADKLQVIFITVDPDRDHLPFLQRYVTQFDPSFIALRGTTQETQHVAEKFKVFYQKHSVTEKGYTMDHSSGIFLIDTQGNVRAMMPINLPENQIKEDLLQLIRLPS